MEPVQFARFEGPAPKALLNERNAVTHAYLEDSLILLRAILRLHNFKF